MKVAVLGFGSQGRSALEYWTKLGHEVTICDQSEQLEVPPGISAQLGPEYIKNLGQFDQIVRSPSVHPRDIVEANTATIMNKVTTATNEFFRVCPTNNIVGVTGTKGKGTTSTLIARMLQAAGKRVHLGGNIGIPPLEMLKDGIQPNDWVVLELANFQLIDLKYSPHIAVCLMVEPEHLNWHKDMEEYIAAKQNLFAHQKPDDLAIYFGSQENSARVAAVSPGVQLPYFEPPGAVVNGEVIEIDGQTICSVHAMQLLGRHNWQNVCAAVTAVWQIAPDIDAMRSVITSFTGLEHRLEFIGEHNGVKYYDDSFGTTPETAIVALEAFQEPKVVILGGSDKGSDYNKLAQVVSSHNVRTAVLIGEMAEKIQKALEEAGFYSIAGGGNTMQEIVQVARWNAKRGDVVLLSTACASFDMFKNYKDRGDQFKQAVQALA